MKRSVPHELKERNELSDAREEEEVGVRPPIRDTEMGGVYLLLIKLKKREVKAEKKPSRDPSDPGFRFTAGPLRRTPSLI